MTTPLRVIIVDDEATARRGLRLRLARLVNVTVVAEAANAIAAASAIAAQRPDLVFLDIEMPGVDGFHMLDSLPVGTRPLVVFVTAHEDRAIDAFSLDALDYLLKPVDDERLLRAVTRARARIGDDSGATVSRVLVRDRGTTIAIDVDEIEWIQSAGDYVRLYCGRRSLLHLASMSGLESALPPERFFRIHREAIINLSRVRSVEPLTNGDQTVVLTTGARLRLSRTRRAAFFERLAT
ncbi:MAG: response regulator transcription factor [Gemmatimonadetes bacterium]|nr:response regulator transcription factor [Gemmatimonadota bacterium]MBL0177785.1 response regulator transcription factor [Gemmatimonadota bacterium]